MSQRPASAAQSGQFSRNSHQEFSAASRPASAAQYGSGVFGKNKLGRAKTPYGLARPGTCTGKPERMLHDKESFWNNKMEKSAVHFQNTRVQTCAHIVKKNGKAVAVQFPLEKTGWKAPTSYQNTKRSSETQSWSQSTFKLQSYHHVGMAKKPLMRYDPNSVRSQLPKPTVVMPYKNSSQIVIGDRTTYNPKHYKTMNTMFQLKPDHAAVESNGGITAERVKWMHKHQSLK